MLYVRSQEEWTGPRRRIPSQEVLGRRPDSGRHVLRQRRQNRARHVANDLRPRWRRTMNTMLRWSPTRQFHFHHDVDDLLLRFADGVTDEAVQRPASWLPAAEGGIEGGTDVLQLRPAGGGSQERAVA